MRLGDAFARAAAQDRAALIGYLPAGFPTRADSVRLMRAMVAAGVDIVEVGLPYSDPLMDGPVIQAAAAQALAGGMTPADVISVAGEVAESGAAVAVMSYWNPVERFGVEAFARDLASAGGCAVITPDLTPEESAPWVTASDAQGIDRVYLVAPSSTEVRLRTVSAACTGFVYAASTMGVTGARDQVSTSAESLVARVRAVTDLPVAVGLGVSSGEQAAQIAAYADGVIVGSAFVRAIQQAESIAEAEAAVATLAGELAAGVRRRTSGEHP